MEALVAVGLAGNVVQFVQFAGQLISETRAINQTGKCQEAGYAFLKYLDTLIHQTSSKNLLQSAHASIKFEWDHHKIEDFSSKLDKFRNSLTLATILALRASTHDSSEKILAHLGALQVAGQTQITQNGEILEAVQQLADIVQLQASPKLNTVQEQILGDIVAPYFINGKAGSGKSTLMKFIVNNNSTREALSRWADSDEVLVINFFFWNLGTTLQKSNVGMLRALIHSVLEKHPELIPTVFPSLYQNWKDSYADHEPSYAEVKRAFKIMIEKSSTFLKLCIFIDGIDEFDGNHRDLSQFLHSLSSQKLKLVISSRPINACLHTFQGCPSLRLQDLTKGDMEIFVKGKLCSHPSMAELTNCFPVETGELVREIQSKASGVFLWVRLVVRLLVDGLEDGDDIRDLRNKLRSLPPDLRDLYQRMMSKMAPEYQTQAAEIFQLFHIWNSLITDQPLSTIVLYFAIQSQSGAFYRSAGSFQFDNPRLICNNTAARIRSRCCGLLEVRTKPRTCRMSTYPPEINGSVVNYLHRTVAEFLVSDDIWNRICDMTKASGFNAVLNICSGCLSMMNILVGFNERDPNLRQYPNYIAIFLRSAPNLSDEMLSEYICTLDQLMCQHKSNLQRQSNVLPDVHWSVGFFKSKAKSGSVDNLNYPDLDRFGSILTFAARTGLIQYLKAFRNFQSLEDLCRYSLVVRALASWQDDPQQITLHNRAATLSFLLRNAAAPETEGLGVSLWQCALSIGQQLLQVKKPENCAELLKVFLITTRSRRALASQKVANIVTAKPDEICPITMIHVLRTYENSEINKLGDELERLILFEAEDPSEDSIRVVHSNPKALAFDRQPPGDPLAGVQGASTMPTADSDGFKQSRLFPPPPDRSQHSPPKLLGQSNVHGARLGSVYPTPVSAIVNGFPTTPVPLQNLPATNHFGGHGWDITNPSFPYNAPPIHPQNWMQSHPYQYHPDGRNMTTGYRMYPNQRPDFTSHQIQYNVSDFHYPEGYGWPGTAASPIQYPPYWPVRLPVQQPIQSGTWKPRHGPHGIPSENRT
ncbi:hypothetical protein K469DRAFT_644493 [Zopfia rhizophila CBS 207.26]|uniref:Uncharacterized protein n=1 Tax=Zopfia rhizophila CBS 207.26 TaxID=1314779 RepID=A0A6A6DE67_9PEZI|nr:hypothetical protein K469DRAFT_644493 [Zopfia rhizophila CBS 207.26]